MIENPRTDIVFCLGEAIRLGMANVPGYGQPDIYYPQIFEGRWKMTRTITPTNVGENIKVITYEVRFLKKDGNVVQDRGFNEANRLVALDTDKSLLIRETKWDVTNPNVLTITYQDGTGKEFRVTKRACEGDINNSNRWNLSSSEFRRITDVGFNGIPNLSASRVLTKWKPGVDDPKNVIEGLELVMEEGNLGDPMAFSGSVRSNPGSISQPPGGGGAKVKSRLRLDRLL